MDYKEIFDKVGSVEQLNDIKKKIDESFCERKQVLDRVDKARSLGDKSLWFIKESFEAISPMLYSTDEGRSLISKYIGVVRNDNDYQRVYSLYESVRKSGKDCDIDYFVNETVNYDWKVSSSKLNEMRKKLGSLLSIGYVLVGDKADTVISEDNSRLDKAISFIAENRKSHKNISEYGAAVKVIKEFVENNEASSNRFSGTDIDGLAKKMIDEFNEKYSDLTEEEIELIREMASSDDQERVFEKYKKVCANKLDEQKRKFTDEGDKDSAEKICEMKEKLMKKSYKADTVNEDIVNLIEMSKLFE